MSNSQQIFVLSDFVLILDEMTAAKRRCDGSCAQRVEGAEQSEPTAPGPGLEDPCRSRTLPATSVRPRCCLTMVLVCAILQVLRSCRVLTQT